SEGERGLLGVGYEPAKVVASLTVEPPPVARPPAATATATPADESPELVAVRELVEQVVEACGLEARVDVEDDGERIVARLHGDDLGVFIGRHGQTIDALQYLANVILRRVPDAAAREVVVDAHGYRDRRARALAEVASRATEEVLRTGSAVALDPMTSVERKIVHLALEHTAGVVTTSEGSEPNRRVVVLPSDAAAEV
ncbi:MAG TPA: RNA-binding cell elongation regulator Jag/EloR, partial [Gaiellales bacterium]|nr:RNA-binding cell elongation regulator Jag/EloR [Gaiellales bacterium]